MGVIQGELNITCENKKQDPIDKLRGGLVSAAELKTKMLMVTNISNGLTKWEGATDTNKPTKQSVYEPTTRCETINKS